MTPEEQELENKLNGVEPEGNIDYEPEEPEPAPSAEDSQPQEDAASPVEEAPEPDDTGEPQEGEQEVAGGGDTEDTEEEPAPLMSPDETARMSRLKDWSEELSKRLGGGMSVDVNGNFYIPNDADDKDLGRALLMMNDADLNGSNMGVVLKLGIAEMIMEISAREEKDFAEVIDEYGICEGYGRNIDTIYQWIRVVQEVPKHCFKFGLTISHYVAASSVKRPKDPKEAKAFQKKKISILERAGKDPKAMSSRQVGREIKEASAAAVTSPKKTKREPVGDILRRLNDCHRAREAGEETIKKLGVTTGELVDQITADEGELILREEIVADVDSIVFHWAPIEVEGEEVTE